MPTSYRQLLAQGRETLAVTDNQTVDSLTDAEWLLQHCCQRSKAWLISHQDDAVSDNLVSAYQQCIDRRLNGEPVAYITGKAGFWNFDLTVTPDTLIPRPETELLVEKCLSLIGNNSNANIIDLGTGSGAIALALAKEKPQAQLTAVDQSAAALSVAKQNASELALHNIQFELGNWLEATSAGPFDLIVSNPPYIADNEPELAALSYEPQSALVAGKQGLADIETICQQAPSHLKPQGWLVFEHGYQQAEAVKSLLKEAGFKNTFTEQDYAGQPRVTGGQYLD